MLLKVFSAHILPCFLKVESAEYSKIISNNQPACKIILYIMQWESNDHFPVTLCIKATHGVLGAVVDTFMAKGSTPATQATLKQSFEL